MTDMDKSAVDAIRDLTTASIGINDRSDIAPFSVLPAEFRLEKLEPLMAAPLRKRGTSRVADVESFNRYFLTHQNDDSRVYADIDRPEVVGILDDHPAGSDSALANWGDHTVVFRPSYSAEWRRWTAGDGKVMTQTDFARFLEENSIDIIEPASADVLDTARGLEVRESHNFRQATRLQDGAIQFAYDVEAEGTVKGRDNLRVPSEFTICVPIFFNSVYYKVRCFLRYRKSPNGVAFFYEIHRREAAELDAFKIILDEIQHGVAGPADGEGDDTDTDDSGRRPFAGTGVAPLLGAPPSARG